jgi:uncharacterized protein (DUF697 family)
MRLTEYERSVQRDIEKWQHGDASLVAQAMNWAMAPMDWVIERVVPDEVIDQVDRSISKFLSLLNEGSTWTYDPIEVLKSAKARGVDVKTIADLQSADLATLDGLSKSYFSENAIMAAVEGGGTGLGGAVLIAADIPLLFGINLRLIQQIGAAYGFDVSGPAHGPLVLSIFNVAASGSRESKNASLREITVAAAALAHSSDYKGRVSGTFRDQNRHLPREIAKNIGGRKIAQMIPIAGAAIGAGINYWFTTETAETAFMLFRALYIERKERL